MNKIETLINSLTMVYLIILALGSYSITRLVVTDTFPLFKKPRDWIFHHFPHDGYASKKKPPRGEPRMISNNVWVVDNGHWIGELLSCPWCAGWYVSLAAVISFVFVPEITLFILLPFALRAFVGGFANKIGGG